MKAMKFLFIFIFLTAISPLISKAQHESLQAMLQDKQTFSEISSTVESYLDTLPEGYQKERLAKHFARWAYYQSMHLGPDGEFVNIPQRTMEAVGQMAPLPPNLSANGSWTFTGPNSTYLNNPNAVGLGLGRADRIAFHPTDPNIIYVGTTSGGLWKTTNGGTSWTCLSNFIPSLGISGIVISYDDPDKIYVLTGDGDTYFENSFLNLFGYVRMSAGVLVSNDAGATWQMTGPLSTNDFAGYCLVQHPANPDILLAGTSDGLYRTTDGGNNWTQVYTEKICDIEFKPGAPSIVYASGFWLFIKSTDAGVTWSGYSRGCPDGRIEIAVSPATPGKVFMLCGPRTGSNFFCGMFVSTNSGDSFTELCISPNVFGDEDGIGDQSEYDIALAVNPDNSNTLVTGGLIIFRSTNGGTTFSHATHYWESGGEYIHPDIHCLAYNPLNNYLYAAGDGGFHRSIDNGVTWTDLYDGLNLTQFYHIDDFEGNASTLLGGCQDNGVKCRTSSTYNFSHINSGDGFDMAIDYTNQYRGFITVNGNVRYFENFYTTVPELIASSSYYFFPQVEINTSNPNVIYYSYGNVFEYTVGSGGTQLGNTASGFWALKTCPSNAARIYAAGGNYAWATTGELYLTSDEGVNWSTISNNPGFPAEFPRISDIGVRPTSSAYVYVCFSGYTDGLKVLYSSNTGGSWSNISYDLPNIPVWSIEVDDNNNVYIGTDVGVFYHAAGATVWEPFYNSLPNAPVTDLAINQTYNNLYAATFGRGIWKTTLWEACPASVTISGNVSGPYFRSASASITMSAQVVGGEGSNACLRSGGYVDLMPGFRAEGETGNKFLAYTGSCDSGMPPDFMGLVPVYPPELNGYAITFSREAGTLQIPVNDTDQKQLVLRLFQDGNARIILAEGSGKYLRDIANFDGKKGTFQYQLDTYDMTPGIYYLYLVVNDQVVHLHELEIKK